MPDAIMFQSLLDAYLGVYEDAVRRCWMEKRRSPTKGPGARWRLHESEGRRAGTAVRPPPPAVYLGNMGLMRGSDGHIAVMRMDTRFGAPITGDGEASVAGSGGGEVDALLPDAFLDGGSGSSPAAGAPADEGGSEPRRRFAGHLGDVLVASRLGAGESDRLLPRPGDGRLLPGSFRSGTAPADVRRRFPPARLTAPPRTRGASHCREASSVGATWSSGPQLWA